MLIDCVTPHGCAVGSSMGERTEHKGCEKVRPIGVASIMSRVVRKWALGYIQTAKLQASLRIRAVSPEALLFAFNFY